MLRLWQLGAIGLVGACSSTLDLGSRAESNTGRDGGTGKASESNVADSATTPPSNDGGIGVPAVSDAAPSTNSNKPGCASGECKVFVTSKRYDGAFGGLVGGDAACNKAASTAGLAGAGKFKAFVATGSSAAWQRFKSDGPWVLVGSRDVLFANAIALRKNNRVTIDHDEWGERKLGVDYWTGADEAGDPSQNCNDFRSSDSFSLGYVGSWPGWMSDSTHSCWTKTSLLCLEDR